MDTDPGALPWSRRLLYGFGSGGHGILDNLFGVYFLFFLLPPVESGLPERVGNRTLLLGLTLAGLIVLCGRVTHALAEPWIAWWSDRLDLPFGRRRFFLASGPLPLVLSCLLLFLPPKAFPHALNLAWEVAALGLFFVFYTWFLLPYLALISELSGSHQERIALTTLQAAMALAGALVVMVGLPILWSWSGSFLLSVGACCALALPLLLAPAMVVDESRAGPARPASLPFWTSVRRTLDNRAFLLYLVAKICLFTAFNIMRAIIAYYPVVLLGRRQEFQAVLMGAVMASAAVGFALLKPLARRCSSKVLLASALLLLALVLPLGLVIGRAGPWAVPLAVAQMVLLGWPVAVLLVVPNAMVADLAEADGRTHGDRREGMFFGIQGFFVKIAYGLAAVLIGFLFAAFGKDAARPLGVGLAGAVAALLGLVGLVAVLRYPQAEVQALLDEGRRAR